MEKKISCQIKNIIYFWFKKAKIIIYYLNKGEDEVGG